MNVLPAPRGMTDADLRARIAATPWFQRFDLRGIITPGPRDVADLLRRIALPERLDGLRVIDLGTCDGAVAFECERRGADQTIALDHPEWGRANLGRRCRDGFDLAREVLGSRVVPVEADLERDDLSGLGTFDLVLFLGCLYHLSNPVGVARTLAALTAPGGTLLVETVVGMLETRRPAAALLGPDEVNGDPSNVFGFNPEGVRLLLRRAGFAACEMTGDVWRCGDHWRGAFRATR